MDAKSRPCWGPATRATGTGTAPVAFAALALAVVGALSGCSVDGVSVDGSGGASTTGTGGITEGGSGGGPGPGSGGATTSTGGAGTSTGGRASGGTGTGTGGAAPGTGGRGSGGAATSTGGRGTGGAGTGGAAATGSGGAAGGGSDVCARWKADRANLSEGTWTGAVASCTPGDMAPEARENALRVTNLYRWLAGLPAVTIDPVKNQKEQACALMMRANNMLSHEPPTTWTCYTAEGKEGAGNSNISSGPAVSSVDLYMADPGNATTIGHRRWILSNSLGPIGIGGTDRSSCMWTLGGSGKAGKPWMAWPAAGTIPLQAMGSRNQTVDSTGWTIQSDNINLAGAQVAVTVDGAAQPVTVTQLDGGYGSKYALRFNPMGWTTAAGKTYNVSVTGIATAINYAVAVVNCP
jgi:hypothetical protein